MYKIGKIKFALIFSLVLTVSIMLFSSKLLADERDAFSNIQQKMDEISDKEKETLDNLFTLVQEIEEMNIEEVKISIEIGTIKEEIKDIESTIKKEQQIFDNNRYVLQQFLKSYQRMGPGSYIEIILSSDSLPTLLKRINILKDITRNTGQLLSQTDASKKNMELAKIQLKEKLVLIEDRQNKLRLSLDNKVQLKEDMETFLASLEEERQYFEEYLSDIQQVWDELKPLFTNTIREFSKIIEEESLPPETIKTTFSLFRIKGLIDQEIFNDSIGKHPSLPEMEFYFEPDKMTMELPKQNLVLSGNFEIVEDHILEFNVQEGSFYGMHLEEASIEELFKEGYLRFDFETLLGSSTFGSVEIKDKYIELIIIPKLF